MCAAPRERRVVADACGQPARNESATVASSLLSAELPGDHVVASGPGDRQQVPFPAAPLGGSHAYQPYSGHMSEHIGERLARLRRMADITQEQLATRSGVSVDVVRRLEQQRKHSARLPTLHALAKGLGTEVTSLLGDPPGIVQRRRRTTPTDRRAPRDHATAVLGADGTGEGRTSVAAPAPC